MTDASPQVQLDTLRASLQVLEAQRGLLGDAIEPARQAVRAQIAALEADLMPPTSTEERRIVTVLFSDIVGSTTLVENIDAEDWRTIVNVVYSLVGRAIQKYRGVDPTPGWWDGAKWVKFKDMTYKDYVADVTLPVRWPTDPAVGTSP